MAPAWSGLTNETAGRNEKWDRSRRKSLCHRIARRAGSEIDINDRRIELACRGMIERRRDIARGTGDIMPQRAKCVFEHHRDKRIIFDDQYLLWHIFPVII